jgi:hypothetical protein
MIEGIDFPVYYVYYIINIDIQDDLVLTCIEIGNKTIVLFDAQQAGVTPEDCDITDTNVAYIPFDNNNSNKTYILPDNFCEILPQIMELMNVEIYDNDKPTGESLLNKLSFNLKKVSG